MRSRAAIFTLGIEVEMIQRIAAALAAAILAGCSTMSPDAGISSIQELAGPRAPGNLAYVDSDEARAHVTEAVRERLGQTLRSADATAIALANNPGLQASLAELRIAEADLVQATRLRNPGFSFGRFGRGEERELERHIVLDVASLVTLAWRLPAEKGLYRAAQMRAAVEVARVADEARRAWIEAVAAGESARYAEQVNDAAEASAEIAQQMLRAGNFSKLAQAREQVFSLEASTQLARARHAALAARERLVRQLGLSSELASLVMLPERLPDLPEAPRDAGDAEKTAMAQRLDVQAARSETEALARSLGLARATGFVNVLEVGYERDTSNVQPRRTGVEVEISLPIFDWGDAKVARAEATYMRAFNRTAELAIRARSEVRESYAAYRTAYDVARRFRDEIVPLRKRISDENLLRYDGMLISVFELLADSREQVSVVMGAMEAIRDYWMAEANLETALLTGMPGAAPAMRGSPAAAASAATGGH